MQSQYKKKLVGDLREHDSQFTICGAIISQQFQTFNFAQRKPETDTQTRASVWSPLVWLDRTIHEHYWISTGWTNRTDDVGSAGGRSQTAGESIRTGDLGNIGKAAVLCRWLKAFVNIQAYNSELHPVVNLNSQQAQQRVSAATLQWMADTTCDGGQHNGIDRLKYVYLTVSEIPNLINKRAYPRIMANDSSLEK